MKNTVIGIDVGGSTTKIVGFQKKENGKSELIAPMFVRATDPITSIYGALGNFTSQNGLELDDIERVMMTGVGTTALKKALYGLDCRNVPEFASIGVGGLYLSGLDEAVVVSMGTGTALVHAKKVGENIMTNYMGGTGVGGGTLTGLAKKMLMMDSIEHIEKLSEGGNLDNVDLFIKDISGNQNMNGLNENLTAANFGKISDLADSSDIALGIINMVAETVAMIAIFAVRIYAIKDIVLIGNMTSLKPIRTIFENLAKSFGVNFIIPENSQYGTVIGAGLYDSHVITVENDEK